MFIKYCKCAECETCRNCGRNRVYQIEACDCCGESEEILYRKDDKVYCLTCLTREFDIEPFEPEYF